MGRDSLWASLVFTCVILSLTTASEEDSLEYMSKEERDALRDEARDMFYHAYNAYMDNAYPADELMPLSCKGRYRGSEPNRGDIDSTLGNFSLTLVDTLDTLVVLGDLEEFENAVRLVTKDVKFETDVIVSLFETNIRMLGGLLSGHILAEYLQQRADIMPWYKGELLDLAKDLGYRFLPAFNTTTGIPYGRVNLKYGMKGVPMEVSRETCTACAGSMILEMAALSRLTGESIFEEKAQKAMDVLWRMRHRGTDLMGSVLNVNSGDWVRRDSGVGAGIDSYYEYCLKAYILLGDEKYLGRFNKHYQAVMKYVSQGPMLLDVHMHRPNTNSKNFMDALLAFWPGLQVLKGDIKPAVETHEMLYQVMQRHNFIPEAFTTDFQVHWGHHPLRPEFLESTYFLYRATGDHYYLGVGRKVLKSLQTYARVPCGYAAVSDVRTNKHDDTMDSFVLSETFKYLFLLFAEPNELVLDLDEFIFTTEGHLLPLTLASMRTNISSDFERDIVHVDEFDRTCPNSLHLFPASVRQPLRNMVEDVCPRRSIKRRLSASQFQSTYQLLNANNVEHLKMLSDMGITTLTLADGRVQLLHTFSNAKTPQDSEEGLLFMQEMVELSRMQSQQAETKPQAVTFMKPNSPTPQKVTLLAGPAHFGPELLGFNKVVGKVMFAYPPTACSPLVNADKLAGKIVIMDRGYCMFIEKARRIQKAGALAGIVLDNVPDSSAATSPLFAMSGDGREVDDVTIPVVFLFSTEAMALIKAKVENNDLVVTIGDYISKEEVQLKAPTGLSMFERFKGSLKSFLAQQITPQTSTNIGHADVAIGEVEQQEEQSESIDYLPFHAEIVKGSLGGEVRITLMSNAPIQLSPKKEGSTTLEKQWRQIKEVFVNQIYASGKQKTGFQIRAFMLTSYYNWVKKGRNVPDDISNKISLKEKVLWFLRELNEVMPNPSFVKMGLMGSSSDFNEQKLLKQHVLTKMDIMVLNLKIIAAKLKRIKSLGLDMEESFGISESGIVQVENYSFLCRLLQDLFDEEDESIKQHIAMLDHLYKLVHSSYQQIIIDRLQRNLEKSGESKYYNFLIDSLQKNLNHLSKLNEKKDSSVTEFMNDSNESKSEFDTKDLFKTPKKIDEYDADKFYDYFIWTGLEKVVIQQNALHKNEQVNDGTRSSIVNLNKNKITLSTLQNQSVENTKDKNEDSLEKDSIEESNPVSASQSLNTVPRDAVKQKIIDYMASIRETLNHMQNIGQNKKFKTKDRQSLSDHNNDTPVQDSLKMISNVETVSENERLVQEISKQLENTYIDVENFKHSLADYLNPSKILENGKLKHLIQIEDKLETLDSKMYKELQTLNIEIYKKLESLGTKIQRKHNLVQEDPNTFHERYKNKVDKKYSEQKNDNTLTSTTSPDSLSKDTISIFEEEKIQKSMEDKKSRSSNEKRSLNEESNVKRLKNKHIDDEL